MTLSLRRVSTGLLVHEAAFLGVSWAVSPDCQSSSPDVNAVNLNNVECACLLYMKAYSCHIGGQRVNP